ncbi:MAG: MFS transporter [Chloroflexi bacterium]|nr:MFS transporter [Chloroflexota bacterium]
MAGLLLFGGTVGDRYGRKKTLAVGLVIFGAASLAASFSQNTSTLIAMRGFQGVGAAFMLPATLSIISDVFERQERAKAIAIWAMVGALAAVVGPALGGFLVDEVGWEAVFWLHIPVVALILVGLRIVPESRDSQHRPLDIPGAVLVTGGLLTMVYGIIQGGEAGWTSVEILGAFAAGGLMLTVFGVVEARASHPMLPLHYLKQSDFTGSFLVMVVLLLAMAGVFFFLTQFFQLVQGRTALMAGLFIMPFAGTMMVGAGLATKFGPAVGPKFLTVAGGLVVMAGMGALTLIEVDSSYAIPATGMALFGLGMGLVMPTVTDTIMAAVSLDDAGIGSAMNDTSREIGFALGVAVLGSIVTGLYRDKVSSGLEGLISTEAAATLGESLGSLNMITSQMSAELSPLVTRVANQSFVDAMSVAMIVGVGVVGLSVAIALAAMPLKAREKQAESD